MRKVSAHYYLKPDGKLGKRPIIELDSAGIILNIRELGDDFKEEPGLEYFPGIIIPGFVASLKAGNKHSTKKQCLINGVLRLKEGEGILDNPVYHSAWTSIQKEGNTEPLLKGLVRHTQKAAQIVNEAKWGVLEKGATPGLLVLQNIDLKTFALNEKASFKIIQR